MDLVRSCWSCARGLWRAERHQESKTLYYLSRIIQVKWDLTTHWRLVTGEQKETSQGLANWNPVSLVYGVLALIVKIVFCRYCPQSTCSSRPGHGGLTTVVICNNPSWWIDRECIFGFQCMYRRVLAKFWRPICLCEIVKIYYWLGIGHCFWQTFPTLNSLKLTKHQKLQGGGALKCV